MNFDFDKHINRRGTNSYKWDNLETLFGENSILPLWVADMDFLSPPAVVEAIKKRAGQGIYGYTIYDEDYTGAIRGWFKKRFYWDIRPEWLTYCPGVVTALSMAVECFTEPGDRIIIQPPVYYPFYEVIAENGREVVGNPLEHRANTYCINYVHLEKLMQEGAKMLLFCSPHNPGGRVWTREELIRLGELCLKYEVLVISDEIHCDLALQGFTHLPFASLSPEIALNSITCLAPSKTFNIPGIQASFTVIPDDAKKARFESRLNSLNLTMPNFFVPAAVKACYGYGEEWLDQVLQYIEGNKNYALDYISGNMPQLQPMVPEATYLLWVDCRELGLTVEELKELMYQKAGVAFSEGSVYGEEGAGFIRINLACPRATLTEALIRFKKAITEKMLPSSVKSE